MDLAAFYISVETVGECGSPCRIPTVFFRACQVPGAKLSKTEMLFSFSLGLKESIFFFVFEIVSVMIVGRHLVLEKVLNRRVCSTALGGKLLPSAEEKAGSGFFFFFPLSQLAVMSLTSQGYRER